MITKKRITKKEKNKEIVMFCNFCGEITLHKVKGYNTLNKSYQCSKCGEVIEN